MAYSRPGVYISERLLTAPLAGGVTANAAGAIVAPLGQGPEAVTLVNSWYEFTKTFGGYDASYPATFEVAAFFNNGGRELYVKRLLASDADDAQVDVATSGSVTVFRVTAKNKGTDGNKLRVQVTAGSVASTYTLTVLKESGVAGTIVSGKVTAGFDDDIVLERYENVVFNDPTSSDYAQTVVNLVSANITISNSASGVPVLAVYPLTGGSNGTTPVAADYTNYQSTSASVFEGFSSLDRPLVIFLPGIWNSLASSEASVFNAATAWAEDNDGFVVVSTDENRTVTEAVSFAAGLTDTRHAAGPAVDHRSGEGRMIPTIERIKPTPTIGVGLTRKELIVLDRLVFRGLVDTMLEINTYTEERHDDFRTEANDERRTLQSLQAKIERTLRQ